MHCETSFTSRLTFRDDGEQGFVQHLWRYGTWWYYGHSSSDCVLDASQYERFRHVTLVGLQSSRAASRLAFPNERATDSHADGGLYSEI